MFHDDKESMNNEGNGGYNRDRKGGMNKRAPFKKKICKFCSQKTEPDYKNPELLRRYTTERGKILPARITGCCSKHQRAVTNEIKKARVLAYLPFEKQN
jgi:small subunit ribosomal protein S18